MWLPGEHDLKSGFTLMEMLLVMAIISIISVLGLTTVTTGMGKARDARRKSDFSQIKTSLAMYYADYKQYPTNGANGEIKGCGASGTSDCVWDEAWCAGGADCESGKVYMKKLPRDPKNTPPYEYKYARVSPDQFNLRVTLEMTADPVVASSWSRCSLTPGAGVFVACQD